VTQQLWEVTLPPPAKCYFKKDKLLIALGIVVLFTYLACFIQSVSRPPRAYPPLRALQQLQPVTAAPDPDAFQEARDGSNTLVPEDENGKASIWKDTTSGARIFCLDSCIVLPSSHHHHRRS